MDAGPDRCTDEWAGDVDPQVRPAAAPEQGGRARGRVAKPCIPRSSSNTSSATPDSAAESKADPISPLDVPGPRAGGHRPGIVRNRLLVDRLDRKSTRLNSSHSSISYAVFCLKK